MTIGVKMSNWRLALAAAVAIWAGLPGPAMAQVTRASVSTSGALANGNSFLPVISFTGRYVVFLSVADNLVSGDTNGFADVFRRDLVANQTLRANLPAFDRSFANFASGAVSQDGRYFVFSSSQTNLVSGDTNGVEDIFLYDWQTSQTALISRGSNGAVANGESLAPRMSADGRYIVFQSQASNLSSLDKDSDEDVFLHDRTTGETVLVSVGIGNVAANGFSVLPDVSADGRFVVFSSTATNLTTVTDTNEQRDIFVRDIAAGITSRVSVSTGGVQGEGTALSGVVSADGRYVAFHSTATNLVGGDLNGQDDVFVYDRETETTTRVNLSTTGDEAHDFTGFQPISISAGGRFVAFWSNDTSLVPGTRVLNTTFVRDRQSGTTLLGGEQGLGTLSGDGRYVVYSTQFDSRVPGATGDIEDVLVRTLGVSADNGSAGDDDGDGMPTAWELRFGLNPSSSSSPNGASGDPDGDGRTNLQEYTDGTHPYGVEKRYFAEGSTGTFFDLFLAIVNPHATVTAHVQLIFQRSDGVNVPFDLTVPPQARRTVTAELVPGVTQAAFSTVIESDLPVVVDRSMKWDDTGYGSHSETSVAAPSTTWYLAEGATHSGFQLFYLLQNPNATSATVQIEYLLPAPRVPVVRSYVVGPRSRENVWVNADASLADTDVSATITSDVGIIVERAMYLNRGTQTFAAGHESAGVTAPATSWFLAEGATGTFFDLFVLVANPTATDAQVSAQFLLPGGTIVTKAYGVPAKSRFNIWVDNEGPQLADTAVSTTITSTNGVPVLVERAMWWPGPTAATWTEAHNSPGATAAGSRWAVADGECTPGVQTYVLIANTSAFEGSVKVTLLFEDGTAPLQRTFAVAATSRFNVFPPSDFTSACPSGTTRRFGVIAESQATGSGTAQIVVERATYSNVGSTVWAAGSNAIATRLP